MNTVKTVMTVKTVKIESAFVLTVLGLAAGCSMAGIAHYTSDASQLTSVTNYADFNSLVDGQSLLHYQQDGLDVSSNRSYFSWDAPGFDGSGMYYPNTGALEMVEITMVDGADFADLEMQVSGGWTGGVTGTNYIWVQVLSAGSLVGEFDVDVLSGRYLGITGGGFDQIMIGAYATASSRDAHNPNARNAIAIDNLRAGSVPTPGVATTLLAAGMLGSRCRRR